tara:strand:+ start:235 stop:396 length:162 start_codon:yes stop_codon:yes gene_type:complete
MYYLSKKEEQAEEEWARNNKEEKEEMDYASIMLYTEPEMWCNACKVGICQDHL